MNLYNCVIGEDCNIGAFVEIGGAVLGNRVSIAAHCFIPPGVTIEDDVFVGPSTVFANDRHPPSRKSGRVPDWQPEKTLVKRGASIGAGACILPGVTIGEGARIGMGAVVTKDVPPDATWVGIPAQELRRPDGYRVVL